MRDVRVYDPHKRARARGDWSTPLEIGTNFRVGIDQVVIGVLRKPALVEREAIDRKHRTSELVVIPPLQTDEGLLNRASIVGAKIPILRDGVDDRARAESTAAALANARETQLSAPSDAAERTDAASICITNDLDGASTNAVGGEHGIVSRWVARWLWRGG